MKRSNRFLWIVFLAIALTALVTGGILFYIWYHLTPDQAQFIASFSKKFSYPLLGIGLVLTGAVGFGLESIYTAYIHPLTTILNEASVIYSSNPSHRLKLSGSREIRTLTDIINDFADVFENLSKDITEQILSARKETEKERNLLAAVMAELPQGVIICNKIGGILLFNTIAKKLFTSSTSPGRADHFIGLGRSIFHLIDKELIAHALEEIEARLNNHKETLASHFITSNYTGRLISIETMPILDQNKMMTGFILTLKDISEQVDQYENIYNWLNAFRQEMSNNFDQTSDLIRDLISSSNAEQSTHTLYVRKISENLQHLQTNFNKTSHSILDTTLTHVPLTRIRLSEFLQSLQKKATEQGNISLNIHTQKENKKMLADAYSLSAAFIFFMVNLSDITDLKSFDLTVGADNDQIFFDIRWKGNPTSQTRIENILTRKLKPLPSFAYVLKQNRSEFNIISDSKKTCNQVRITAKTKLKIDTIKKKQGAIVAGSRPEFYDFDLFKAEKITKDIFNADLKNIIFTVFDTETTGISPDDGDEIISIAAVRIVNARIVYQDIFEELIDPKRDIPLESYKIHGINYEMVKGKPDISTILPLFKIYTHDTVLLGHNIAFDMKMFKVKEALTKTVFTNPVMDTLLLSAVLYPTDELHDMESIAQRLGVNIIGRHTALGDAIATAKIFLKMRPILNSNGIFTLKNALEASKKTYYARLKY